MFYWVTSVMHLFFLTLILLGLIERFTKKERYPIVVAIISIPIIFFSVLPYANWRVERALRSLFDDNLRYAATDYERATIDRVNVYSLSAWDLDSFPFSDSHACVEAYVNLPNRMGGMTGFDWVSQEFYYSPDDQSVSMDLVLNFLFKNLWTYYEIDYGRCRESSLR